MTKKEELLKMLETCAETAIDGGDVVEIDWKANKYDGFKTVYLSFTVEQKPELEDGFYKATFKSFDDPQEVVEVIGNRVYRAGVEENTDVTDWNIGERVL